MHEHVKSVSFLHFGAPKCAEEVTRRLYAQGACAQDGTGPVLSANCAADMALNSNFKLTIS